MFYLVPVERQGYHRFPRYVASRFNASGKVGRWSFMDFGVTSPVGLLSTDTLLNFPDVMELPETGAWSAKQRADLQDYMRQGGIEDRGWIASAADWREGLHRSLGMAQAMQSAVDDPNTKPEKQDPSKWLGRDVYFGLVSLTPVSPVMAAMEREANRIMFGEWELIGLEWVSTITGKRVPVIAGGALPATEAFTDTNNTNLTAHSANWTMFIGVAADLKINSNSLYCNATGASAYWNADTFSNDQYSQGKHVAVSSGRYPGLGVRMNTGSGNYYYVESDSGDGSYLLKLVSSVETQLGSTGAVVAVNDVDYLSAVGTTITFKRNGSTLSPPGAQTDSSISSGSAGVNMFASGTPSRLDDWEGGNVGGAAASLIYNDRQQRFQNLIVR